MPSRRILAASALVGVGHAAALLGLALVLGYPVGPDHYGPVGLLWRYGGLVLVAAVPTALLFRYGLVSPAAALAVTAGGVALLELSPPGPTFERLGTALVVEDGLYVVRYMVNATVWLCGYLLVGLVEYAVRREHPRLPGVEPVPWLPVPASRRRATSVASAVGLLHAVVMTWFAARLGVTVSGMPDWPLFLFGAGGMWVVAAVPAYLLLARRLVAPATLLAALVLWDARTELGASVEDAHALYFGGWFLVLALVLVAAGVEYALRRLSLGRRFAAG